MMVQYEYTLYTSPEFCPVRLDALKSWRAEILKCESLLAMFILIGTLSLSLLNSTGPSCRVLAKSAPFMLLAISPALKRFPI
jgi:hypothetical protein